MKNLMIISLLVVCFSGFSTYAQSEKNQTIQGKAETEERREEAREKEDVNKTEISPQQLPEEARMDIADNYHNARILKAYKINYGTEDSEGYLVEVKKGPKIWTIEYDKDGNPTNKINPMGM